MGRPRPRVQWLLWSTSAAALVCVVISVGLLWLFPGAPINTGYGGSGGSLILPAIVLGLVAVGALIGSRQPTNLIGLLFSTAAVVAGLAVVAGEYGGYGLTVRHGTLPGSLIADWFSTWGLYLGLVPLLVVLPLIFPDGRLLSARWKPVIIALVPWLAVSTLFQALQPGDLEPGTSNPFAIGGAGLAVLNLTQPLIAVFILLGLLSLGLRYHRGTSEVRHQLKWLIFSVALYLVTNLFAVFMRRTIGAPAQWAELVSIAALLGIPVATLTAVLKYRLYDIDVVISRTLVFGLLAAFISAVYVAIVVGVGTVAGSGGQPNLLLSIVATAVVAVAFQPVRERLQRVANRLVYGRRATPYEVLSRFSEHVAETYAADEALPRMARVLAEATGADQAQVWLRAGGYLRPAARWPTVGAPMVDDPVAIVGQDLPDLPGDQAVPVLHHGELLGALTVAKRRGESLTPIEQKLVGDLASQAGLVLKNVAMTAELLLRLEDLRASRHQLVSAQDQERRSLERDLHDGAQQNLVAIKVKLGLAVMMSDRDPNRARALVDQLSADLDEAQNTLRDLARGIYPPLLADQGLEAALAAQARKATVATEVHAEALGRYPQEVEAAVYFCCLEALQNVQKYARATKATIRVFQDDGDEPELRFEVTDDGSGFDRVNQRMGSGLRNMEDRLDALGGTLLVTSAPGRGTALTASLPIPAPEALAPAPALRR